MTTFITSFTILITTCAGFAVGFLFYSPFLFLKAWMRGEGVTKDSLPKRTTYEHVSVTIYSFVAHGALASVLAIMFELLSVSSLKVALSLALLLTFGFIITSKFIEMIYTPHGKHYDARHQIKFLVGSLYYIVAVVVMTYVLMYFR